MTTNATVCNTKSGKIGWVRECYKRRSDGKQIVEVDTTHGVRHWLAHSVEAA